MKNIAKLSEAQIAQLSVCRDRWLAIGLSTEPADRPAAERAVAHTYAIAGLRPPRIYIWLDSPYAGVIGAHLLSHVGNQVEMQVMAQVGDQVWAQVRGQVEMQVWAQVRGQVGDQVWAQVEMQVLAQVRGQVGDQVWAQVEMQVLDQVRGQVLDQVRGQVLDQVRGQVLDQVRGQVLDQVNRCGYGCHDASLLAFYHFFRTVVGLPCCDTLIDLEELSMTAGWYWPFRHLCLLTERPTCLKRDAEHRLHCEDGPALQYPDDWGVWALHGVRVPDWLVETPDEQLDPRAITEISNAEVRREFVRKIGVDRLCYSLGAKAISTLGDYQLLVLDIGDGLKRYYLKMRNASIPELWHVEEVSPECRTVEEALHWREPDELRKIPIDDVHGENYYQQGDVCLWPAKAKSRKRFPTILT